MGNAVIIITAGTPTFPLLPAESAIRIKEPITTDDLIEGIKPVINNLEITMANLANILAAIDAKAIRNSNKNLFTIMQNLELISNQVVSGEGVLGRAIFDPQQAQQLSNTLNNVEIILSKIEKRVDESQPLLENITALRAESKSMVTDVRHSLDKIDHELEHLPEIVDNTQTLIQSTEETVQSIQKIWPLSTFGQDSRKELLINEGLMHD